MARRARRSWKDAALVWALGWFLVVAGSGEGAQERYRFVEPHMGTLFGVTLYAKDGDRAEVAARAAFARVAELDRCLSDYAEESELNRLCRAPAGVAVPVSEDLCAVMARALEISRASGGAFDPTLGNFSRLWRRSRRAGVLPGAAELAAAREVTGARWVRIDGDGHGRTITLAKDGMRLDLGGIAKGFAADEALKVLRERGCGAAMVAAGGDIALGEPPPGADGWEIGVVAPEGGSMVRSLSRCGVSTSGDREQYVIIGGVRYGHILDPRTGLGLVDAQEVTVIAGDATTSDALATAACVWGRRGYWPGGGEGFSAGGRKRW